MLSGSLGPPFTASDLAVSAVVGGAVFPSLLGLAQLGLFKPLRVTCSKGVWASFVGGASICFAGSAATLAAVKASALVRLNVASGQDRQRLGGGVDFATPEVLLSTVCGAIVFRALGGRFSSVLPSSLLKPGAFAQEWIPAKGVKYATDHQKFLIQRLGRRHGCHSCGRRRANISFAADHQPPSKLVKVLEGTGKEGESGCIQRFLPQCLQCSSKQGGVLANAGEGLKRASIVAHPFSLRPHHLFLPVPFGIACLKSHYSNAGHSTDSLPKPVKQSVGTADAVKEAPTAADPGPTLKGMFVDSSLSNLVADFPLLIVWNRIVGFLDSFKNPGDAYHLTLWFFIAIAALGAA